MITIDRSDACFFNNIPKIEIADFPLDKNKVIVIGYTKEANNLIDEIIEENQIF